MSKHTTNKKKAKQGIEKTNYCHSIQKYTITKANKRSIFEQSAYF
ncbi:hypothetical protein BOVAB4_1926 [Bacteroides ovatus]|nr:hypothetical protein BOVAB4_1926 [Bacteroides ovatus]